MPIGYLIVKIRGCLGNLIIDLYGVSNKVRNYGWNYLRIKCLD